MQSSALDDWRKPRQCPARPRTMVGAETGVARLPQATAFTSSQSGLRTQERSGRRKPRWTSSCLREMGHELWREEGGWSERASRGLVYLMPIIECWKLRSVTCARANPSFSLTFKTDVWASRGHTTPGLLEPHRVSHACHRLQCVRVHILLELRERSEPTTAPWCEQVLPTHINRRPPANTSTDPHQHRMTPIHPTTGSQR